jgi:hypothetical protein
MIELIESLAELNMLYWGLFLTDWQEQGQKRTACGKILNIIKSKNVIL